VHELSLSSAILDTVLKHADGRKVNTVELTVGALRQVVPESLEFYWGVVTRDTVCDGAQLEQRFVQARLRCNACAVEWGLDAPDFRCSKCAGTDVEVLSGTEFLVESIDVTTTLARPSTREDKETACIAPR
jgi:hydrogenase nickel incorporation protein HypA/HybF